MVRAFAFLAFLLAGCAGPPGEKVSYNELYKKAAQEHQEVTPVIVIPGLLGSRLLKDGELTPVWGAYDGGELLSSNKPELLTL